MKHLTVVLVSSLVCACGPSYDTDRVLTPEERLQEQERLAYEAELESQKRGPSHVEYTDEDDETKTFDVKQAELELRRATLSAVTCPEIHEKTPKGTGEVTVHFRSDGKVREASIAAPYSGTPVEECVLNAYRGVIVPTFKEPEYTMNWKVDLSGKKQDLMPKEKDEVAERLSGADKKEEEDAKAAQDAKDAKGKKAPAKKK